MSSRLVHRNIVRLASNGLHLTAADIRRRASTHEGLNLFIDNVHVVRERLLFGADVNEFVRRPVSARHHPRHRLPTVKSGSFAVTVHGSFCGKEVIPFHHIEGNMDFKIYFNIMETVV
ncbi:hypothetical protein TELCIR_06740 [Teladorsagia circumcincta]|uniref:Uncharacterized protein n=1 Tax=Teladorsagia circumcincta TaxID=45464 RepID=A0A2G9UMH6_TELCI|nr:hypothetical protein TELCIR_06740 [Teladorsagia circumcincta]